MKNVDKPWGSELWLELNDSYCMKILRVSKGQRLSLQYHNVKTETSFVVYGRVKVTLGEEEKEYGPNSFWHCPPGTVHRMEAITDSLILECSSPEVEDVMRLDDDYGREWDCECGVSNVYSQLECPDCGAKKTVSAK